MFAPGPPPDAVTALVSLDIEINFNFFAAPLKARFHYERGKEHSLFVLLIFFCARFNRKSIKETKNALFHARSGNGPLSSYIQDRLQAVLVFQQW